MVGIRTFFASGLGVIILLGNSGSAYGKGQCVYNMYVKKPGEKFGSYPLYCTTLQCLVFNEHPMTRIVPSVNCACEPISESSVTLNKKKLVTLSDGTVGYIVDKFGSEMLDNLKYVTYLKEKRKTRRWNPPTCFYGRTRVLVGTIVQKMFSGCISLVCLRRNTKTNGTLKIVKNAYCNCYSGLETPKPRQNRRNSLSKRFHPSCEGPRNDTSIMF